MRRAVNANRRGRRRAQAPSSLAGALLWVDFADPSSLTLSGSEITSARNKGSGADVSALSTGPTLTYDRNGRPYAAFDNTPMQGDFVLAAGSDATLFVVGKTNAANGLLVDFTTTSSVTDQGFSILSDSSAVLDIRTSDTVSVVDVTVPWTHTDLRLYTLAIESGVESSGYVDSTLMNTVSIAATRAVNYVTLGRLADASFPLDGILCEVICFDRVLSDAETQQIETYLRQKWAIDWKAVDWSDYGYVVSAYHASYPENTGSTAGTVVTDLADYVGSNDASAIGGNSNSSFDWTRSLPTVTIPASRMIGGNLPTGYGEGQSEFLFSFAGASGGTTDTFVFAITSQSSDTSYVALVVEADGEISIQRRVSATSVFLNTGIFVDPDQPFVCTVGYDGLSFRVLVNDEDQVSIADFGSLPSINRWSAGGVNRITVLAPNAVMAREIVLFDGCPDQAGRQAVHDKMLERNPLPPTLPEESDGYDVALLWRADSTKNHINSGNVTEVYDYKQTYPGEPIGSTVAYDNDGWNGNRPELYTGSGSLIGTSISPTIASGAAAFTVVCAYDNVFTGSFQVIGGFASSTSDLHYTLLVHDGSGNLVVQRRAGASPTNRVIGTEFSGRRIVAWGYDGTNAFGQIYGESRIEVADSVAPVNLNRFGMGGAYRNTTLYYVGATTEVHIYREALPESAANAVMTQIASRFPV